MEIEILHDYRTFDKVIKWSRYRSNYRGQTTNMITEYLMIKHNNHFAPSLNLMVFHLDRSLRLDPFSDFEVGE
jgi:hypothetical protein